jgi:hypothetical protein
MKKTPVFILSLLCMTGLGHSQEQTNQTLCILPEDVVQDSITQWRAGNYFVVSWTYTQAGANKFVAVNEAHEGQDMWIVIGSHKTLETGMGASNFRPIPPYTTNYIQWKEGWLKHRTDKIFCKTEDDEKAIIAGLEGK